MTAVLPSASPFSVLCVCTGNVCRSPATERLLQRALGPGVTVRSAGTHALVGRPVEPEVAALLKQAGADPTGFVARQLTVDDALGADLVLALAREHRSAVVDLAPRSVRRTFTLRELARIVSALDPAELPGAVVADRLRALVPLAGTRRQRSTPVEDDVPDPYGGLSERHRLTFDTISAAVDRVAGVVAGGAAQPLG